MKKSPLFFSSAFTLVELIVVIAVLAVLAAISFSTVANITSGARDSARLTDISSMKTSLETYNATKGGFPMPDNAVAITWSGNLAWSQGTFGDNTSRALNTISRPKDPKWSVDYSYSVVGSKREYEVATVLEKATSFNGISKAYAQGEQYDTVIKGNYNGVAIKVSSAISTWILSVPTLIASDIKDAKLENVVFAYPKSGNEPFSYTGVVNSPQAVPAGWTPKQVWSGALVLPKTDSELQGLTTDLKTAYTGSPAASSETIKSLLATSDGKTYGANVVNNVGGSISVSGGGTCKICGATSGVVSTFSNIGAWGTDIVIGGDGILYALSSTSKKVFKINPLGISTAFTTLSSDAYWITIDNVGNIYTSDYSYSKIDKTSSGNVRTTFANVTIYPRKIVFDTLGNLYAVGYSTNSISKITPAWVVNTFASGLSNPEWITIDASGNLYVGNFGNNTISKITPAWAVSTFTSGWWLAGPAGMVIDSAGNLYIANTSANNILKINSSGLVSIFASGGGLASPYWITMDSIGNLYVVNNSGNDISKITPQ